ncbi:MAG: hypothetical protein U9O97_03475 [Elusimicrobiota bacterium]|nr:hypothetical protein [Elusimicrobiota bacterium]
MKNLMNWTAAGMMLTSAAAFSPVIGASSDDKNEMTEFRQWKKNRELKDQNREEHRKRMHENRMDRLSKDLELTSSQRKKISGLMENSWKEVTKARKAFSAKVTDIRTESDKKIEKELTKEQLETWKRHRRDNMRNRRRNTKNRKDRRRRKTDDSRNRYNRDDRRGNRWKDRD